MKVNVEFELPEEKEEYMIHVNASKNHCILWDIAQYIRKLDRYDDRKMIPTEEVIKAVREIMCEFDY